MFWNVFGTFGDVSGGVSGDVSGDVLGPGETWQAGNACPGQLTNECRLHNFSHFIQKHCRDYLHFTVWRAYCGSEYNMIDTGLADRKHAHVWKTAPRVSAIRGGSS